jgi:murein DD-endopeptidase MepM/ murein hydrolase activator NlpD
MEATITRTGWVGRLTALLLPLVFLAACATQTVVATAPPPPSDDDDFSELIAQLRADLNRQNARVVAKQPALTAAVDTKKERDKEFAARAKALFSNLSGSALQMPVVGVHTYDLSNSWGDPRDGGVRTHKGIDIFAPKGTPIVAVTDGIVTYIGEQPKGGRCLWLSTESGTSFYYAHLDRWASGLYEGLEVHSGDLLGYVGNTGNAKYTPSHLHFAVNTNDEMVNPYPYLTKATYVRAARVVFESAGAMGTR